MKNILKVTAKLVIIWLLTSLFTISFANDPDQIWNEEKENQLITKLETAINAPDDRDGIEQLLTRTEESIAAGDSDRLFSEITRAPEDAIDISIINKLIEVCEFSIAYGIYNSKIIREKLNSNTYALLTLPAMES